MLSLAIRRSIQFVAIAFLCFAGACRPSESPSLARPTICALSLEGARWNGRAVRVRGFYSFSRHGGYLTEPACLDRHIRVVVSESALDGATGEELANARVRMPSASATQSMLIEATGEFRWIRWISTEPPSGLLEVTQVHSFAITQNDLSTACQLRVRMRAFCECVQRRLGPAVTAEHLIVLDSVAVNMLHRNQMAEAVSKSEGDRSVREGFASCAQDH